MTYWDDKVVLVTGAASGIGQATAWRLLREGASVALLDRDRAGIEHTRSEGEGQDKTLALVVDLKDEAGVIEAVKMAATWKQRLDGAVNVAGISPAEEFLASTREYWDELLEINLRGTYLVGREAARVMAEQGEGAIVNVSSVLALVGDPTLVSYSATKGGISAMTRAMAVRLGPHRIRVNAVCPGDVATPLLENWIEQQANPGETRAKIASSYPLGYYCEPSDVAGVIVFLLGPDARCITGANIVIDCGLTVKCY
jgi:NAD(P)-dependent dehydrogenase (short-subunit alcohol dehydrogenase family)